MIHKVHGALRLAAIDLTASQLGLIAGMSLADARARTPRLLTVTHRPDRDAALLDHVLEDFSRFTPMISLDPPNGLVLDVTGCAHLFGGETGLFQAVRQRAKAARLDMRASMAGTAQCARALARFGAEGVFDPGQDRNAVLQLTVAALELSEKDEQALRRAGLKRLVDLDTRARAPLAARFGADFPSRLARILGDEDVRITPHRPPAPIAADRIFFEPLSTSEDVERVLADLLRETCDRLDQAGQGGRAFEAAFYRVDGLVRRIEVGVSAPTRDATIILRLFREKLAALSNPLDPGFGFDQMRMSVTGAETLGRTQDNFYVAPPNEEHLNRLIDRLSARLGPEAMLRFEAQGSHIPERAQKLVRASATRLGDDWPELEEGAPPLRPLQMFHPPQPVETLAEAPDGHPFRFRWRRVVHNVARAEGPERIAGEWWRAPSQRTRDYYRVEDTDGRRFWLFRQGLYGADEPPRWFIHGLFA